MAAEVLTPRLRPLDERVLAALDDGPRRAGSVAALLHGQPVYRCEDCGKVTRVGGVSERKRLAWEERRGQTCAEWAGGCGGAEAPVLLATCEERREVREILRGLEHVGLARQAGGWWRRA